MPPLTQGLCKPRHIMNANQVFSLRGHSGLHAALPVHHTSCWECGWLTSSDECLSSLAHDRRKPPRPWWEETRVQWLVYMGIIFLALIWDSSEGPSKLEAPRKVDWGFHCDCINSQFNFSLCPILRPSLPHNFFFILRIQKYSLVTFCSACLYFRGRFLDNLCGWRGPR